jgi:hypothetical protein
LAYHGGIKVGMAFTLVYVDMMGIIPFFSLPEAAFVIVQHAKAGGENHLNPGGAQKQEGALQRKKQTRYNTFLNICFML